jgi:hypothetical protein
MKVLLQTKKIWAVRKYKALLIKLVESKFYLQGHLKKMDLLEFGIYSGISILILLGLVAMRNKYKKIPKWWQKSPRNVMGMWL